MINIRKSIFNLIDLIKGKHLKRHIRDIKILNHTHTSKQLQKLLAHAVASTNFYKEFNQNNLSSFPIVNKVIIKRNVQHFLSKNYKKEQLISVTTSGSTGTPFTVFIDVNKKRRNTADTIVFANKAGYEIGQKLYYLKIWSAANHKSNFVKLIQNIETIDVLLLDDEKIASLLEEWQGLKSSFGIIGYASALETICKYFLSRDIKKFDTRVNSIIAISESLDPEIKKNLSSILGKQVVSRYSNVENGILAQQRVDGSLDFEINSASYKVEIFDVNSDIKLPNGQIGRIILTDLYNLAMPLIRYDTGDIGSIEIMNGKEFLTNLSGRKLDSLYNTAGQIVNSLLVYRNMWQYKELDQYQLIQQGPLNYRLIISSQYPFNRSDKLKKEFKEYLGEDAIIDIIQKDEIPLLSSGKRRKVVQKYYK